MDLQLNGGVLHGSILSVTSDVVHQDDHQPDSSEHHHIEQSDKPRAGSMYSFSIFFYLPNFFVIVAAEYLAKGYSLSDQILVRAIELDSKLRLFLKLCTPINKSALDKHGISKRFLSYFQNLDKSVGERTLGPDQTITGKIQTSVGVAAQHAKTLDEKGGYSKTANEVSTYIFFFTQ